jgi:hypothetical protein
MMIRENMWFAVEDVEDNKNCRVYHSKLRLLDEHAVEGGMRNTTSGIDTKGLSFDLNSVLAFVLDVRGVTAVETRAYQVTVVKSPVVAWAEIDNELMPLLYGVKQALTIPVFNLEDLLSQQS